MCGRQIPGYRNPINWPTLTPVDPVSGDDSRSESDCSGGEAESVWRGQEEGGVAAHLMSPPPQLELANGGVWARAPVPQGTRFGPFLGKWVLEPANHSFAWEVSVADTSV